MISEYDRLRGELRWQQEQRELLAWLARWSSHAWVVRGWSIVRAITGV